MKYVMLKARGLELPVIFPAALQHREPVEHLLGITNVSAGFCRVSTLPDGSVHVDAWGGSMSLGINSRPADAAIIREHLQQQDI